MASGLNVKIDNKDFDNLRDNIEKFATDFDKQTESAVADAAEIVAEYTRQDIRTRAKHQTGKLESAVGTKKFFSKPGKVSYDAGYVQPNTDVFGPDKDRYFVYWEQGSSHEEPRHSARNAKNKTKAQVLKTVQQPLEQYLRK